MSLNFNFKDTSIPVDELWYDTGGGGSDLRAEFANIVWLSIVVDMGHIKDEAHAVEFFQRARFFENLHGPIYSDHNGESLLSLDIVKRCIGLTTNVPTKSRGAFIKRHVTNDRMMWSATDPTTKKTNKVK